MKTLRDYRVAGALYVNDTGLEAQVSDQVTLFLDTDAEPDFPVSIVATIQHPIIKVECGSMTSYVFEYNEADLDGAAALLRAQDIIDATVISGVTVVADELDDEIAARIAAVLAEQIRATAAEDNLSNALDDEIARAIAAEALKAPTASPTFTGVPAAPTAAYGTDSTQLASTAFVQDVISAGLAQTPQALSGAGAVSVTTLATELTSTDAAQALTLADGSPGQIKAIFHGVDGGSMVLTPTTKTGFTTITFTAAGESALLQFFATRGWMILSINGAVAA
jgi:hypothetical protein